jgi:hypothetical protein
MPRSCYTFNTYVPQEFGTASNKIILYKLFLACNVLERQEASSASAFVSTGLNNVGYRRFVKYLPVVTASSSGGFIKSRNMSLVWSFDYICIIKFVLDCKVVYILLIIGNTKGMPHLKITLEFLFLDPVSILEPNSCLSEIFLHWL